MTKPALLVLENGRSFRGTSFGFDGESSGEVCFNTGMTGYQEVLTDPSYSGQIVTMTYPHIGNTGVNPEDMESGRIQAAGFIVRELCETPSNHRSTQSLPEWLADHRITGIQGIDTRSLTRMLRSEGSMNGIISCTETDEAALHKRVLDLPSMKGLDLASVVSCERAYAWTGNPVVPATDGTQFRVAAVDFGIKHNILRLLAGAGCHVTVYPAATSAETLLADKPDGVFLSNGPGDPDAVKAGINTVTGLLGRIPLFGICLGHQILALALGADTYKLTFGHRGVNHPVRHLSTGSVEITSQNHGFAVRTDSLPPETEVTHINLNDGTLEGFRCTNIPAFSVQYHPESSPGPHDSRYLFKTFTDMMRTHA